MAEHKRDRVDLGCGTLILIALIVLFFSHGGELGDLDTRIQGLQEEVVVLQDKIDTLTRNIELSHPSGNSEAQNTGVVDIQEVMKNGKTEAEDQVGLEKEAAEK